MQNLSDKIVGINSIASLREDKEKKRKRKKKRGKVEKKRYLGNHKYHFLSSQSTTPVCS